jgi:S-adenosylmethionine synthetase
MSYLWTSEAVSAGHPDKVADQLADTVLDAYLKQNSNNRVACEVTCMHDEILVTGEISFVEEIDVVPLIRKKLIEIGYDRDENSYNGNTIPIRVKINQQSTEIHQAVDKDSGEIGAGDQGLMFGYACDETESYVKGVYMPLAHHLSFEIIKLLEESMKRQRTDSEWGSVFLPDCKSQVTMRYKYDSIRFKQPLAIDSIVISTQYRDSIPVKNLRECLKVSVIEELLETYEDLFNEDTKFILQPSGAWHIGGPASDTGLSGRKIVVDNYGADCPIGGGSFSGKDPSKVDRSAAYAARHIAKNIVAANLAHECRVQLSYAIGVVEPVSVRVESFDTSKISDEDLTCMVKELVDLTPKGIIDRLNLTDPVYSKIASGGHFGRNEFAWEKLDLVNKFKEYTEGKI